MTVEQIKNQIIINHNYDFLRINEHIKNRIIFLTLGGSYAYDTNIETSDIDIRGCALNSPTDLIGLSNFEQMVDTITDTVVYGFNKLVKLLINCNPNTIEMLGCKPEHYLIITDIGKEMINNRKMFLSQRAIHSFGGYATQQLRLLENNFSNRKKDNEHLNKHAMHLIRLYLMCLDILEKEDIITYREQEHDLLMKIRGGEYQLEDGSYRSEFFEMVNWFEERMNYAKENTSLPERPNMKKIEEFVMSVNRMALDI